MGYEPLYHALLIVNMVSGMCGIIGYFYFSVVFFILGSLFKKTIIPLTLVGYEMTIANSALHTQLAIYHLISNTEE